ncbi:GNAT family N-acetyltransferase [Enterocloster asparagiformis]|uniref:GNAT family N-acetyltransferase n=1 Tax=Enterocloster asparagiformis TaxID=333367 RepID=UPI002A7F2BE5|nr:GNAT family N-acetyltransferase [Enterocloster asparagiformis]
MEFIRLTDSNHAMYHQAMDLYKASFPIHEQRESHVQTCIMGNEAYHFNLIYENNRWVGMILCWETEEFIYIEHFCILPEMRGKKYGQKALELLGGERKTVILEIDPPIDDVSVRRKRFYERSGYQANRFAHVHPPYKKGFKGHDLVVMSSPDQLSEAEYRAFNSYLSSVVMKRCLITKSSY